MSSPDWYPQWTLRPRSQHRFHRTSFGPKASARASLPSPCRRYLHQYGGRLSTTSSGESAVGVNSNKKTMTCMYFCRFRWTNQFRISFLNLYADMVLGPKCFCNVIFRGLVVPKSLELQASSREAFSEFALDQSQWHEYCLRLLIWLKALRLEFFGQTDLHNFLVVC